MPPKTAYETCKEWNNGLIINGVAVDGSYMAHSLSRLKRIGVVLAVAALLVTAGCSSSPQGTTTGTTAPTQTTAAATTTQAGGGGTTTNGTTTQTTNQTTTQGDQEREVAATGQMAVVIDDDRLDLASAAEADSNASFWFDTSGPGITWKRTDANVTLADALETVGVNASNDSITYRGTTYTESTQNTTVVMRVNGEPVNPTQYVLQEGDEVWVEVITHPLDQEVPGDHIPHDQLHVHGNITFTVDGHTVDFTREKYQNAGHSAFFHFEGGDAYWHAHSWSVTLKYAMSTLQGINVTESAVTYNGTTYERSEAQITIQVNGEPVDPSTYVLKDGDNITITVEAEESSG